MSDEQKLRNSLRAGHKLHWYQIEKILGQGGFGITYLAYDTNLDQHVAIKEYLPMELAVREGDFSVYPASTAQDARYRWGLERFLTEARTLARFKHPAIVRVLSVFEANNTAYMVMEYQQGVSLQQVLDQRRTLPEKDLVQIVIPLLEGLETIHAQGFIHRDIKPSNVFIRSDGHPVLLDFGSARQALGQETRTLTSVVSPGYAPFEQYYSKSDRQGPWTDIYGLGATLYRCLTGLQPMAAIDRSEAILRAERDVFVSASEIGAGQYSSSFLAAVDCALFFNETKRPQSVAEWRQYFEFSTSTETAVLENLYAPPADDARTRFSALASEPVPLPGGTVVNPYARGNAGSDGQRAATPPRGSAASAPPAASGRRASSRPQTPPSPADNGPARPRSAPASEPRSNRTQDSTANGYSQQATELLPTPPERTSRRRAYLVVAALLIAAVTGYAAYTGLLPNSMFGTAKAARLVAQGDRALAAGQVYEPTMTSALAYYRRAYEISPGHADAEHGLRLSGGRVVDAIATALADGRLDAAEDLADHLEGLPPGVLELRDIHAELAAARARAGEAGKRESRVAAFLAAAAEDVKQGNFVGSGTDNALARYRAVQILDADNAAAAAGLVELAGAVAARGQQALADGALDEARRWYDQATLIDSESAPVVALGEALGEASAQATTAKAQQTKIAALLKAATEDLANNRLSTPAGENALDRYRQIETLDPGNSAAREGIEKVHERYIVLANQALTRGEFAQATQFAGKALEIRADSEIARALQRDIVAARERADAAESQRLAAEAEARIEAAAAAREAAEQARADAEQARRDRQEAEAQRLLAAARAKAEAERERRAAEEKMLEDAAMARPRMVVDFHGFHPKYARDGLTRDRVYSQVAPLIQAAGYEIVTRGQVHDAGYKWTNVKLMAYRLNVNENTATGLYSYVGSLNILADATLRISLTQALDTPPLWNRGHNGLGPPTDLAKLFDVYVDMTRAYLSNRPGRRR